MTSFDQKAVIVTGAAGGIGRAAAITFAGQGAKVLVADIDKTRVRETAAIIGDKAIATQVDVADWQSCRDMVELAVEKFGRLDVIFNNAGIAGDRAYTAEQSLQNWQRVVDINLNGVFYGTRAALPHLQNAGGGVIINTASVDGLIGMGGISPYVATKHAVIGFTKTVALEYGKDNIRCVSVAPGYIKTDMTAGGFAREELDGLANMVPLGKRGAEPQEVANLVVWLASDQASYVTGSFHQVDGGIIAGVSMEQ
ncbi:SDR family oxidoreductase [Pseudomaricurvus alkylphenolicus]|uniref:SDR family NAD(P)-dependent oxidoreductase n=1 Tax=Pseudomaricurvus alkylphenolicus TaxID=1306991 RepID=UPI00141DA824|nr:SDR family NAD(P)-dependent oxidoreductase [Pseudomaricurvus alkylphenolicus]NIB41663.1 SDR family oxidoreductase [Pseudomaricurvus alkylphenolicus]